MSELKKTTCSECKKEVKYTTKKPKMCTTCRSKAKILKPKKTGYKKKPDNKNTQGELVLFRALDNLLKGHPFINHGYYSILPSPKGYPMQLDRYYPNLRLAWEFDGKQHSEYNKFIHNSKKNFDYYKECDKLKEVYCKKNNITLIRVAWNYKITPEALKYDIKKANIALYKHLFEGEK